MDMAETAIVVIATNIASAIGILRSLFMSAYLLASAGRFLQPPR